MGHLGRRGRGSLFLGSTLAQVAQLVIVVVLAEVRNLLGLTTVGFLAALI